MNQSNFNGQSARTKESAMRGKSFIILVVALVASIFPFIIGCEGNDEGYGEVHMDITARALACGTAPLPSTLRCPERLPHVTCTSYSPASMFSKK